MVKPPPSASGPLPRRLPGAERRQAVLRAALPLFAVRGFEGTTTRELARAAGVTEPVLYRHFRSKADLFAAVLGRAAEAILARLAEAVRGAEGAPARLLALADDLEPTLAALEDEFRVLDGAAAVHADARTVATVREIYGRLGGYLSRVLAAPGLRRGVDAVTAGHLLLEIGLGASLVRPLGLPATARPGYGAEVVRILRRALTDAR